VSEIFNCNFNGFLKFFAKIHNIKKKSAGFFTIFQAGRKKIIGFLFSKYFVNSQILLNHFLDDCQPNYITQLGKNSV
jgi:hypothetical protein